MAMAISHLNPWLLRGGEPPSSPQQQQQSPQQHQEQQHSAKRFNSRASSRTRHRQKRASSSASSSSRQPWTISKDKQVDEELDAVLVPSDCMSGYESDDSDWSVGWLEPHSADFSSDSEDSFAVLVPCYGTSSSSHRRLATTASPHNAWAATFFTLSSATSNSAVAVDQCNHVDQWLSSLQQGS